jgi:hypothetical protein
MYFVDITHATIGRKLLLFQLSLLSDVGYERRQQYIMQIRKDIISKRMIHGFIILT